MNREAKRALEIAAMSLKSIYPAATPEGIEKMFKNNEGMSKKTARQKQEDRLLRIKEAAEMLSVSPQTLGRYARNKRLNKVELTPGHPRNDGRIIGGAIRYKLSEIQRLITGGLR